MLARDGLLFATQGIASSASKHERAAQLLAACEQAVHAVIPATRFLNLGEMVSVVPYNH
jgi:hypothetical protein